MPRPLAIQRLAAALVAGTHGLDRAHIGTICDALTAAGIDPTVWTARAITDTLNADMRARGWTWPDHIANPGAFLSSRLRRLNWSPPDRSTTKAGGSAADSIDHTPRPVPLTDASRAEIVAAQQEIRRVLRERAQHSATTHCHDYATASTRRDNHTVARHTTPLSLTVHREAQQQ